MKLTIQQTYLKRYFFIFIFNDKIATEKFNKFKKSVYYDTQVQENTKNICVKCLYNSVLFFAYN